MTKLNEFKYIYITGVNEGSDADDEDCDEEDFSKWPNEQTTELIERFKGKTILYDVNHKNHYNKQKKLGAIESIANKMNMTREYI